MFAKAILLFALVSSMNSPSAEQTVAVDSFFKSMETSIKSENLKMLETFFDPEYNDEVHVINFMEKVFTGFEEIDANFKILFLGEFQGLLNVRVHISIIGNNQRTSTRTTIIDKKISHWIEINGDRLVIISDSEQSFQRPIERYLDYSIRGEMGNTFQGIQSALNQGNKKKFLSFFEADYMHDGETFHGLEARITETLLHEGVNVEFKNLSTNELSGSHSEWPNIIWVDVTITWLGTDKTESSRGFIKSGRTTFPMKKSGGIWRITGNGEPAIDDAYQLKPAGNLSSDYLIIIILATLFAGGLVLSLKNKRFIIISFTALMIGSIIIIFNKVGSRPNVVIITIDTLRSDYLSCYGSDKIKTPFIDGLAGDGVLFENTISVIPTTGPSHSTIFTSLYPSQHGVLANGWKLENEFVTLAEVLKQHGYTTAAFVSASPVSGDFGFSQGFDVFKDAKEKWHLRGGEVVRNVINWLGDNSEDNFFLWVHFFDPHAPLEPIEPFKSRFTGSNKKTTLYGGEVAYTDSRVGMILAALKSLGIYESSIIIFTADHGESLGEHDIWGHGKSLYNETVRVPLIVKAPAKMAARWNEASPPLRIKSFTSLIDIYPSVLDMLRIDVSHRMEGESFLPLINGKNSKEKNKNIFIERRYPRKSDVPPYPTVAILQWPWKLIKYEGAPGKLFNVKDDPQELENQAHRQEKVFRTLTNILDKWGKNMEIARSGLKPPELDDETRKKLKALGYIY